jgi:hypothetical protein
VDFEGRMNTEVPRECFVAYSDDMKKLSRRKSSVARAVRDALAFQGHVLVLAGCPAYVPLSRRSIYRPVSHRATAMYPTPMKYIFHEQGLGVMNVRLKWSSLLATAPATSEHGPCGDQIHF